MSRGSFRPAPLNFPGLASKVIGWPRLAASTQSGGEWTNIVDVINPSSPITQTDTDRRAAVGITSNDLSTMVFDGSDVHLWPLSPAHNSTTKIGLWFWYKPINATDANYLYAAGETSAPVSAARFTLRQLTSQIEARVFIAADASTGRSLKTPALTLVGNIWHGIYFQYDSSRGGDANVAIYVNGVNLSLTPANIGAGGTLTTLQAATGSATVGAGSDSDTPTLPLTNGCQMIPGPTFNDNLTQGQIDVLANFEKPI